MLKAVLVPIGQGRSVHCKGLRSHCEIALGSRLSGLGLRLRRLGLAEFLGAGRNLVFKCVSSINSELCRSEVSFAREVSDCSSEVSFTREVSNCSSEVSFTRELSNCSFDFIEAITSLLRVRHRQS